MTRSVCVSRSAVPTVCLSLPAEIVENEKQQLLLHANAKHLALMYKSKFGQIRNN